MQNVVAYVKKVRSVCRQRGNYNWKLVGVLELVILLTQQKTIK